MQCKLLKWPSASFARHVPGNRIELIVGIPDIISNTDKRPLKTILEAPPQGASTSEPLHLLRIRQQEILAELGVIALQRTPLPELLDSVVRMAAEGLQADFCKILEYLPEENSFVLRSGVGWDPGLVGVARVGADLASPSGYALQTGKPVISNHLENEERFRTPDLLRIHGIKRAINVILQGEGSPFGVLEVDSRYEGEFTEHDISFLQGAANVLGMAIERQRYERSLREAVEHHQFLMSELNHRVKNSLQLVLSMFNAQAKKDENPGLAEALQAAAKRVSAIARVHERLYREKEIKSVNLTRYLADVCRDLQELASPSQIEFTAYGEHSLSTDRAVLTALVVGELVTNAAKHAYSDGNGGLIKVVVKPNTEDSVSVVVRDEGDGLPEKFDIAQGNGFGMTIVRAFLNQGGAEFNIYRREPGTEFEMTIPPLTVARA